MEDFKSQVKKGFERCKLDIEDVKYENSKLKNKIDEVLDENKSLKDELVDLKAEIKGLKIAIDFIKDFKEKQTQIQQPVQNTPSQVTEPVETVNEPIQRQNVPAANPIPKRDPYEALLAFKAKTNKREVLKQKMMTMIGENGVHLSELKFLFVEHYNYCSKATFYNYLKELELSSQIKIERDNGKNFVYLTHMISREI